MLFRSLSIHRRLSSLAEVTKDVGELTKQMQTMQRIVWGIPASMLIAFAAVAVAVLRGV